LVPAIPHKLRPDAAGRIFKKRMIKWVNLPDLGVILWRATLANPGNLFRYDTPRSDPPFLSVCVPTFIPDPHC